MVEPEFNTLEEAKEFLRDNWEKGTKCPCCGQRVKLYKRALYGTIAADLIRLYHLDQSEFHHIGAITSQNRSGGGDFAKLTYWGFVEEAKKTDPKKRTSGMWKITERGVYFVENRLIVLSHAQIYDGKLLGLTGSPVNIKDVLGEKFNYEELMA